MNSDLVCVGAIISPHGIKGEVKVRTFTENPENILKYGELTDGKNKYDLHIRSVIANDLVIASIKNITTRNEAGALRNVKLYVNKSNLPVLTNEDEFYQDDLIGLHVKLTDGSSYGKIIGVYNFGSCDVLEVKPSDGKPRMFPFIHEVFTHVDIKEGYVILDMPEIIN